LAVTDGSISIFRHSSILSDALIENDVLGVGNVTAGRVGGVCSAQGFGGNV
jgi:hypothetical protein